MQLLLHLLLAWHIVVSASLGVLDTVKLGQVYRRTTNQARGPVTSFQWGTVQQAARSSAAQWASPAAVVADATARDSDRTAGVGKVGRRTSSPSLHFGQHFSKPSFARATAVRGHTIYRT